MIVPSEQARAMQEAGGRVVGYKVVYRRAGCATKRTFRGGHGALKQAMRFQRSLPLGAQTVLRPMMERTR